MENVVFRRASTIEDYKGVVEVMREAWSMETSEIVPVHVLKAVDESGGFLLLAESNGKVVGFALGFIGYSEECGYYLYSHMLGVLPEYRGTGIAQQLKLLQREWALSRKYDLVTWTFDPHQGRNARFNFGKLGVIARRFYVDYYGELHDELNRGLPTDRFMVEWWINSRRVRERLSGKYMPPSFDEIAGEAYFPIKTARNGVVRIATSLEVAEKDLVALEFPYDINKLRDIDLESAIKWKLLFRDAVRFYLSRGYIICEHVLGNIDGEPRNFYLVVKSSLDEVLEGNCLWR
jgi:predicted GNAT superfamily acetyltransferase